MMIRLAGATGETRSAALARVAGLLALVTFLGGWVGEPYDLQGCDHHAAAHGLALDALPHDGAHAGDVARTGPEADSRSESTHPGDGTHGHEHDGTPGGGHGSEHCPCTCLGACGHGGNPGAVSGGSADLSPHLGAPTLAVRFVAVAAPVRGPTPHLHPWPTAPPHGSNQPV